MNVTELLEKDHRKVEHLFELIEKTKNPDRRSELFEKLWTEFSAHANAEEETIYPALCSLRELEEKSNHAYDEHDEARGLFTKMMKMNPEDDDWMEECEALKLEIEQHVKEEEEDILPKMEDYFSDRQLKAMATAFQEAKRSPRRPQRKAG